MGYSGPDFGAKAMTERDSDIEFDFFEELEPREPPPPEERPRGPRGGPPRRSVRGPTGFTPLLRLAGLIAFAILIVVLLVFWVQSCRGASKKHSYQSYFSKVKVIGDDSQQIGRELTTVLTTPGIKVDELTSKLNGLAQQQQQDVARARELTPPGPLRSEQQNLLEALEFRVTGIQGLAATFQRTAGSKDIANAGLLLSAQAQRLTTSDIVWDDLFRTPSIDELKRQGVTGVAPPDSNFVQSADFASSRYWVPILQRISGAATGGTTTGLHGTGLISTKALPSGQVLSTSQQNTITAGTDLGFAVTVEDTGDSQEVQVKVTLTIQQTPKPIVKTQTIDLINPGEQKVVEFHNLGQVTFATRTTVRVEIKAVQGEKNTNNNSAEYPVIFSLG